MNVCDCVYGVSKSEDHNAQNRASHRCHELFLTVERGGRRVHMPPSPRVREAHAWAHARSAVSLTHNLVAEPGFELMEIVLPKRGFLTLNWQHRTGCIPLSTSHDAQVPALH